MKWNIILLLYLIGFFVIFNDLLGLKLDVLDSWLIDNKNVYVVVVKFFYY